jgi:hypothetical protein
MDHPSLDAFLTDGRAALAKGPIALILAEDAVEVDSTLRHHLDRGFRRVILFGGAGIPVDPGLAPRIIRVTADLLAEGATERIVNRVQAAAPAGTWFYYGYNAEYLFYPFCEDRSVGELTTFIVEERRDTALTYVVDLYAGDLATHPLAVSLEDAHLDRAGYYALARKTGADFAERQLDFFGGLRWRFEEHVPPAKRRIDRVSLFRARPDLHLRADHTFDDPEYNTFACPWHNSPTAALCSFRMAKALRRNPRSRDAIRTFRWHNSAPFLWASQQLMDLGLMEPGQWF